MLVKETEALSAADLYAWLATPVRQPLSETETIEAFHLLHPKVTFVKTLPTNSVLLDIGAGDGGLLNFREWLLYKRRDIQFCGLSLEACDRSADYEEFHTLDLEQEKPTLRLSPNAAVASQFIEHIEDKDGVIKWLASVLPSGSLIYFDWPSPHTVDLPSRASLLEKGYDVTTVNFFDDSTHRQPVNPAAFVELLKRNGFQIRSQGIMDFPYLAENLKHHGIKKRDHYMLSMAIWLKTGFVTYLTARKI